MYCFLFVISSIVSISFAFSSKSLYKDSDPLWQLDSDNFHDKVLRKNHLWIIEFYSSWCGHCVRFAPKWKQFGYEVRTWKNIIEVGAVNCNDPENVGLCREYEVSMYPTIKLFWRNTNETSLGKPLDTSSRDIASLQEQIINFLESHWNEGVPTEWPDIHPVSANSLTDLTKSLPDTRQSMLLFIEPPDVYVGRLVILDLSWQKNVVLKRVLTTNQKMMRDLNFIVAKDTVPAVIRVFRNGLQLPVLKFSLNDTTTYVRDQIFENVIGTARNLTKIEDFFPSTSTQSPVIVRPRKDAVYMTDLENALSYLLNQEIGGTKTLEGEKLSILKTFLFILKTYFPGRAPIMAYLSTLQKWIYNSNTISGEEFVEGMDRMQQENHHVPKMKEWVGCKGSEPHFRGYPCSLWTLFHTLTVQADSIKDSTNENSGKVLFAIRDYVKNFFSCAECSDHFSKMAINIENEVNSTRDAVLWLWAAHNKVNHRLSGDVTEDPRHPKIQFPSLKACPTCQSKGETSGDITWDQDKVWEYLHQFYGKESIKGKDQIKVQIPFSADQNPSINNSAMVIRFFSPLIQLFLCYCFTTFVSFWMYFEPYGLSIGKTA